MAEANEVKNGAAADGKPAPRARKPKGEEDTLRQVLVLRDAIVVPDGAKVDEKKLREALGLKASAKVAPVPLYEPLGEFKGSSKTRSIEAFAGKVGTPDAKQGVYRAVPAGSWKGAEVYEAPPAPLVQRRQID